MTAKGALALMSQLVAAAALGGFLLGLLGRHHWFLDLFAHFRVQYAVVLVVCGLFCVLLKYFKIGAANLLIAVLIGWTLLPLTAGGKTGSEPGLKLISYNVYTSNDRHKDVLDFLRSESADIVFLMETNDRWAEQLRELADLYPYRLESPREDNFGIVLLSKLPFDKGEVLYFGSHGLPAADVTVTKEAQPYRLLGIHTLPPASMANALDRNQHLADAARLIAGSATAHQLLVGDFNLTPYSPWFTKLLEDSKLQSIAPGYDPTWQRGLSPFAIPIDHALTSPTLTVLNRKVGPSLGSDHCALIVEVAPARK